MRRTCRSRMGEADIIGDRERTNNKESVESERRGVLSFLLTPPKSG